MGLPGGVLTNDVIILRDLLKFHMLSINVHTAGPQTL